MRCIIGYVNLVNNVNPSIEDRKGLITIDKTYGIDGLKKHMNTNRTIYLSTYIISFCGRFFHSSVFSFVSKVFHPGRRK